MKALHQQIYSLPQLAALVHPRSFFKERFP
jgi:hypothetical protein